MIGHSLPAISRVSVSDGVNVYRANIASLIDSESLAQICRVNCEVNIADTISHRALKPGIQSQMILKSRGILDVESIVAQIGIDLAKRDPSLFSGMFYSSEWRECDDISPPDWVYVSNYWAFIADKYVPDHRMSWHTHETYRIGDSVSENGLSWSLYLQIPDNLCGNEGHIEFLSNDRVSGFLPSVGDLIFFPPTLYHRVKAAPRSRKARITLAGQMQSVSALRIV